MLFDETGDRLSPTHAVKQGRRYRYYISHRLAAARRQGRDGWRLPAQDIEKLVLGELVRILSDGPRLLDLAQAHGSADLIERALQKGRQTAGALAGAPATEQRALLQALLHRVSVGPVAVRLEFQSHRVAAWLLGEPCSPDDASAQSDLQVIELPAVLQRRGVEARFVTGDRPVADAGPDGNLVALIATAQRCLSLLRAGEKCLEDVAQAISMPASEVSRVLPLAFLAPDIVRSILDGDQPHALTAKQLKRLPFLPVDWVGQRQVLGFPSAAT